MFFNSRDTCLGIDFNSDCRFDFYTTFFTFFVREVVFDLVLSSPLSNTNLTIKITTITIDRINVQE